MGLERFKEVQQRDYPAALHEIKGGRKTGHWMWYIFPQLAGLSTTETSRHYAIRDIKEATAYLMDEELGIRLTTICKDLLALETNDAFEIFGSPDDLKLRSSMTLLMQCQLPSRYLDRCWINFMVVSATGRPWNY